MTLALVFVTGVMLGAVAMNAGRKRLQAASTPVWTSAAKAIHLERLKKELDLTPEQTEQMETILDDFTQLYRTVLSDGKARIFQILNPEQRVRFERMLQGTAEARREQPE
jgi:Spy/CpxP family protein refolding chaperone